VKRDTPILESRKKPLKIPTNGQIYIGSGGQKGRKAIQPSSGKRIVLFKGGGEPVGETVSDRPALGVPLSGESRFEARTTGRPRGRGFEGPEMVLLATSFVDARGVVLVVVMV
jgi:hypothetical protein